VLAKTAQNIEFYRVKNMIDIGYTPNRGILPLHLFLTHKYFTFAIDVYFKNNY
jgi:hypothetical protein